MIILLVLFLFYYLLLHWSPVGVHIQAIGGNREAARMAGLRVRAYTILSYLLAGFAAGLGNAADDGRADYQAVGHGAQHADVLGPADTEADADGQSCLLAEPGDVVDDLRGQLFAFAGDAGHRDVVDEARRMCGDTAGPLRRGRGRDEMYEAEILAAANLGQGPRLFGGQAAFTSWYPCCTTPAECTDYNDCFNGLTSDDIQLTLGYDWTDRAYCAWCTSIGGDYVLSWNGSLWEYTEEINDPGESCDGISSPGH